MHLLYLSHRIPYPPNKGDKIRSFNEIKYLSKSHKIDLICLADDKADLRYKKALEKYCGRIFVQPLNPLFAKIKGMINLLIGNSISTGYFYFKRTQQIFNKWIATTNYDAIICFSSPMAEYVFHSKFIWPEKAKGSRPKAQGKQEVDSTRLSPSALRPEPSLNRPTPCALHPAPSLTIDFCDLDSDKWRQYAEHTNFPLSLIYRLEFNRLLEFEKEINQKFDYSIFVSDSEANLFYKLFPEAKNVHVIHNGVDTDYFSPNYANQPIQLNQPNQPNSKDPKFNIQNLKSKIESPILMFPGAMDYHANIDGVTWFCNNILPLIKKEYANVQFYIVGSNPHPNVRALDTQNGIRVTGFVDDIRPYYTSADVCVIPLRLARGVQNKVLESMAMEKAVVVTSKAVEGTNTVNGNHVLVADDPIEFASKVSMLLKDEIRRDSIGIRARQYVKKHYNWQSSMSNLEEIVSDCEVGKTAHKEDKRL